MEVQQKIIEKLTQSGLAKAVYRYSKDGNDIYTILTSDEDGFASLHIFELYYEL